MNRISRAFSAGKAFIPFITGGYPDIKITEKLLYALHDAGADLIEIGIPFSDPIAEGPVIEVADEHALRMGCTAEKLFDLVSRVRADINIPLLFMTYYNPIFVYDTSKFTKCCVKSGIDGIIVPDLPFEERDELLKPCVSQGLKLISLIAPTSKARIKTIAQNSDGFIYCVSSLGVTGERHTLDDSARHMVAQVRLATNTPCAVGFGISTSAQARNVAGFADGVIVGSAIIRLISKYGQDCVAPVSQFAKEIKQAITSV
ncbi:MAG: tryptophan synthase subunit alpha [Dehalococcoidia bacterium]|nr:tryptophan synthase subunit alpha [Dehalococcoidia bacterium]